MDRASAAVIAATAGVAVIAAAGAYSAGYISTRLRKLGGDVVDATTQSVAFDHVRHGAVLTWDARSLIIDGRRVLLFSGEFHPWRIPDRERWRPILETYKAAGLNCIRIYFHWGYHSPAEGVYHFDGNRDMDYLLSLCEELRLFVLAAPGPYICAETQAGGHPIWLIAKRDVRIRHCTSSLNKVYDPKYSDHCRSWLRAILPIIAAHQITNPTLPGRRRGCVLALQIENENFEVFKGIWPTGLSDDMRFLAKVAREECGINIPLFHNDAWEDGSYIAYPASKRVYGKPHFGLDLYSFDKYVVFAPTSSPLSNITSAGGDGSDPRVGWAPWKPETVTSAIDGMEKKVRSFGGAAATGPIFIAELQGGWFNHHKLKCTYDNIYSFYGEDYTRLIVESVLAQGVSAFNIYMFYGGTNWGNIGDPDVYTSYDYSACIRENTFLSGRGRKLRLAISFFRSFASLTNNTTYLDTPTVEVRPSKAFNRQRVATQGSTLTFVRNFNNSGDDDVVQFKVLARAGVVLNARVPYKTSYVALGNYVAASGHHLLFSAAEILLRLVGRDEVWIVKTGGEMAFDGDIKVETSVGVDVTARTVNQSRTTVIGFQRKGWFRLAGGADGVSLIVVALSEDDMYTFSPSFEEDYWVAGDGGVSSVAWGSYGLTHDPVKGTVEVLSREGDGPTYFLTADGTAAPKTFSPVSATDPHFAGLPFLHVRAAPPRLPATPPLPTFKMEHWQSRGVNFKDLPWKPLPENQNAIDLRHTSTHIIYKLTFNLAALPKTSLKMTLNLRHRCTIFVNDELLGGHTTYSLTLFRAGAKNGPDASPDNVIHDIPVSLLRPARNEVHILIETYGLSRQAFVFDDVRSPRGLISATIDGLKIEKHVAGVDVTTLHNAYESIGIPEPQHTTWSISKTTHPSSPSTITLSPSPNDPTYFRAKIAVPAMTDGIEAPVRLRLDGPGSAFVSIAGVQMARYHGDGDTVQRDFHVPAGLVTPGKETEVVVLVYGRAKDKCDVTVAFVPWEFESGDASVGEDRWSGSLKVGGGAFVLRREVLPATSF